MESRALELPQSQGLSLSQAVLGERSAQRRKLLAWGTGPPPAFLASGWTQVDTLPFVSLGVLLVVVSFVFWEVFFFSVFFFFCTWPMPDSGTRLVSSTFRLPCTSPRQPLGGLYGLRNHFWKKKKRKVFKGFFLFFFLSASPLRLRKPRIRGYHSRREGGCPHPGPVLLIVAKTPRWGQAGWRPRYPSPRPVGSPHPALKESAPHSSSG